MDNEKKLILLRNLYTGLQLETMVRYSKAGILNEVEKEKRAYSLASGENSAKMLGITKPEEAFTIPSAIVDCAGWEVQPDRNGLKAECRSCRLVGLGKKMGIESPCRMYCLNGIEGMIKAMKPDAVFSVESTLWTGENCIIDLSW